MVLPVGLPVPVPVPVLVGGADPAVRSRGLARVRPSRGRGGHAHRPLVSSAASPESLESSSRLGMRVRMQDVDAER